MKRSIKLRWANKLMRSKYFVVLTDKESVIALDGVDPSAFDDIVALNSQAAAIADFRLKLDELIKAHDKVAAKLLKPKRSKRATTKRKSKKITVKGA